MKLTSLRQGVIAAAAAAVLAGTAMPPVQSQSLEEVDAIIAGAINNVAMMVAAENGYWREQGLDVRLQTLDTGSQISKALLSGAADIGAGNATSSVPLSRATGSALTFAAPYHNNPTVVNGVQRVGVIASARIRRQGRRREIPGRQDHRRLARQHGRQLFARVPHRGRRFARTGEHGEPWRPRNADGPEAGNRGCCGDVGALCQPDHPRAGGRCHRGRAWRALRGKRRRHRGDGRVFRAEPGNPEEVRRRLVEGHAVHASRIRKQQPRSRSATSATSIRWMPPPEISFMRDEFDPRISPCTEAAVLQEQEALIAAGRMDVDAPIPYDQIVQVEFINALLKEHAELLSDLKPLPATLEECGGRKSM